MERQREIKWLLTIFVFLLVAYAAIDVARLNQRTPQEELVHELKKEGYWDRMDFFYLFGDTIINLDTVGDSYTLTRYNYDSIIYRISTTDTLIWNINKGVIEDGFISNGTSNYIDTEWSIQIQEFYDSYEEALNSGLN